VEASDLKHEPNEQHPRGEKKEKRKSIEEGMLKKKSIYTTKVGKKKPL